MPLLAQKVCIFMLLSSFQVCGGGRCDDQVKVMCNERTRTLSTVFFLSTLKHETLKISVFETVCKLLFQWLLAILYEWEHIQKDYIFKNINERHCKHEPS